MVNLTKKVKLEFTEQELNTILNGFSVRALSDNIDEEDKKIARKIIKALKDLEKSSWQFTSFNCILGHWVNSPQY